MATHMQQNNRRHPPAGFTLIEVCAIVAVSSVCVVLGWALYRNVRENTKPRVCQSNLKQIGLALMQYSQDNDELYPRTTNGAVAQRAGKVASWRRSLDPYLGGGWTALWRCTEPWTSNPNRDVASPYDDLPLCYDVVDCGPVRPHHSMALSDVISPPLTFLVIEKNGTTPQAQLIGVPWDHDTGEAGWTNILYAGHFMGSNYLFADGHVRYFEPLATVADGINRWHLKVHDPVSPRAMQKLQAAQRNFQNDN